MTKLIAKACLLLVLLVAFWGRSTAQETFWSENFEQTTNNLPSFWSMDAASAAARNTWRTGNQYVQQGYTPTPEQPVSIAGSPRSRYLHIGSPTTPTIDLAAYDRSRAARCTLLTPLIQTINFSDVNFSFWYLSNGQIDRDFGQVLYRMADGEWFAITPRLQGVGEWTQLIVDAPLGSIDHGLIQFAFVWTNDADNFGEAPSFAVDDMALTGTRLTQGIVVILDNGQNFCAGGAANIPWLTAGTFAAGNQFRVQLSDAAGNFTAAAPNIGSIVSTRSEGLVPVLLPNNLTADGAYRVRILSSSPADTSSNAPLLKLSPPAVAGQATLQGEVICPGSSAGVQLMDFSGNILWQISTDGINFEDIAGSNLDFYFSNPLSKNTFFRAKVRQPGCGFSFSNIVEQLIETLPEAGFVSASPDRLCAPGPVLLILDDFSPNSEIQWEISDDGFEFFEVAAENARTLQLNNLSYEQFVRAAIRSPRCPGLPVYSNEQRIAYGLDVIVIPTPEVPQPGETVEITLLIDGTSGEDLVDIAFTPGDGSDPLLFEGVGPSLFTFSYTYSGSGIYNYTVFVSVPDGCSGTTSGTIRVSEQTVELSSSPPAFICGGYRGEQLFNVIGTFEPDNIFEAQLSDASGSFQQPVAVGSGTNSPIAYQIPIDQAPGENYRIRVVSSSPEAVSNEAIGITILGEIAGGNLRFSPTRVCQPEAISLELENYDEFSILEWQISSDGVNFEPIADADQSQYDSDLIDTTTWFRVTVMPIAEGNCPTAISDTARINFGLGVSFETTPSVPVAGEPVLFRITVEGEDPPFELEMDFGDDSTAEAQIDRLPFALEHIYIDEGAYEVNLLLQHIDKGCAGNYTAWVTVSPEIFTIISILDVTPEGNRWCPGQNITVTGDAEGEFANDNRFVLELSDDAGSFDNSPLELANELLGAGTFALEGTLPTNLPPSTNYSIRVRGTGPAAFALSGEKYTVLPRPAVPVINRREDTLFTNATGVVAWEWFFGEQSLTGADSASFFATINGDYYVSITDSNGCTRRSEVYDFIKTRRATLADAASFRIYPNPTRERLTLSGPMPEGYVLNLYDLQGRKMPAPLVLSTSEQSVELSLNNLSAGVYLLEMRAGTTLHRWKLTVY